MEGKENYYWRNFWQLPRHARYIPTYLGLLWENVGTPQVSHRRDLKLCARSTTLPEKRSGRSQQQQQQQQKKKEAVKALKAHYANDHFTQENKKQNKKEEK